MEQMKAFIEKAKTDKDLMAKLNALCVGEEAPDKMPDKIVALAAEHGFAITAEDYRKGAERACTRKSGELKEEELEAVAGGDGWGWTENRYDQGICGKITREHSRCFGVWEIVGWCDHYDAYRFAPYRRRVVCAMGRYDYEDKMHW
ncbi:MAG: Nif11-like leader peptide family natural product precursor [Synergistaceae bacterium]|nr:Nif11-like leader peptide family natural product precursor [Synergistaceae bacterium]